MKEPLNRYTAIGVAVLLLLALANMSSGYYEFLRWIVFLSGLYFAFGVIKKADWYSALLVGAAILFNPFAIISFSKDTWSLVDIGGAILYFSLLGIKGEESPYTIKKSRLDDVPTGDFMGYTKELENILHEYGKLIEELHSTRRDEFPAMVFPVSLLPASKSEIEEAIDTAIEIAQETDNQEQVNSLQTTRYLLTQFIADEDALRKNKEFAESPMGKAVLARRKEKAEKA